MIIGLGVLAALSSISSTQPVETKTVSELPYIDAVRHAVVEDCISALTGGWSLNDPEALSARGLEQAPMEEEEKRIKPSRVAPDLVQRRFANAVLGIRLDAGISCMVTFDGPQRIEAREKLFAYLDSPISGFKRTKTKKSISGFVDERSYVWRMSKGVEMRYDIGTRDQGSDSGIVSAIIWMPWIK